MTAERRTESRGNQSGKAGLSGRSDWPTYQPEEWLSGDNVVVIRRMTTKFRLSGTLWCD